MGANLKPSYNIVISRNKQMVLMPVDMLIRSKSKNTGAGYCCSLFVSYGCCLERTVASTPNLASL